MKNYFNPANLREGEARCFYFNPRSSGHFLILIFFIILILPVFVWTDGEIKKKIKITNKNPRHPTVPTQHLPSHA